MKYGRIVEITPKNPYTAILYKGHEVPADKEEAKKYSKMAADLGSVDGMNNYCKFLQEEDLENDEIMKELARYSKMAADKGHIPAMYNYGLFLENGSGVPADPLQSLEYYKKAADEDFLPAINRFVNVLCHENLVDSRTSEFNHYVKKGSELGDPELLYRRAIILRFGFYGEEEDINESEELLRKSSEKGYQEGQFEYAEILREKGKIEEAKELLKQMADKGDFKSILKYSHLLFKNDEGEVALSYLKKAADEGCTKAMTDYFEHFQYLYQDDEDSVSKEQQDEAMRYLLMAVEKEDPFAEFLYASCFYKGFFERENM